MIQFDYLYKGLCGLAHAYKASSMAGHLGAAVVAGYFFGEEYQNLDDKVYAGVEGELDRIMKGEEAFWYNAEKAGISVGELFQPLPKEKADKKLIATLPKALERNIEQLRQSGHNVIFTSIAVRALHDHSEYATPAMVTRIRKLIDQFNKAVMGRGYFGKEKGWIVGNKVELPEDKNYPAYKNEAGMVNAVVNELIRSASIRRQGFGGWWHLINHTAGLLELSRLGYASIARKGLKAHHHHVCLWRSLPDMEKELGKLVKSEHDPKTVDYWTGKLKRDDARLTHRIKTLYGFATLMEHVEDKSKRKAAEDAVLYLMA